MRNELFVCRCGYFGHQMIITYDNEWSEVFVSILLIPERNIFKRIWKGIKYIFKKNSYQFEEFILDPNDANKLEDVIKHLKRCGD